jgi:hypothetical protein
MTTPVSSLVTVRYWLWNATSQVAHVMAGYILVSKTNKYFGDNAACVVLGLGIAAALYKEFYYDYHYESADERGSSLLDFSAYVLGMMVGLFI